MINVSNEFKELMQERTDFKEYAEVTLADGTEILLNELDFTVSNNSITDGAGMTTFPVGVAVQKHIQIELLNDHEQFNDLDFFGAKIRLYLTFQLSETVEQVDKGAYTVVDPETRGETVIITAYDDMYKADKSYHTSLPFPVTLKAMLIDICSTCGIPLLSTTFRNDDIVLDSPPDEEYTFRQIIGYIAMLAGGNARINNDGYLEIKTYEFLTNTYDGGTFDFADTGNVLDGGTFGFEESDNIVDGGNFNPWTVDDLNIAGEIPQEQLLGSWNTLTADTNDITITGVKISYETETGTASVLNGSEGYVISVENPLVAADVTAGLSAIADALIGLRFRKFEGDHISNPLIEFMDMVFVKDRRGRIYKSIVTDVGFQFFGYTTLKNSSASYIKNEAVYSSDASKVEIRARKLIEKERTDRELAVAQLSNALANSSGLYQTTEVQPDGSSIYYLHDKPTLEESQTVIKLTAEAIGVSTDGGETYPYGFTVTGEMITRILSTEGINADWIKTGALIISDGYGNILFSANMDTKAVRISGSALIDGSINAEKVNTPSLMASDLTATGKFQVKNNVWEMVQSESGLCIQTTARNTVNDPVCLLSITETSAVFRVENGYDKTAGIYMNIHGDEEAPSISISSNDATISFINGAASVFADTYVHGDLTVDGILHNNSDRNYKTDISPLPFDLVDKLEPVQFRMKYDMDRIRYGFIAQDVETALQDAGVDTGACTLVAYDLDENGDKANYRLAYEEFIPLLVKKCQQLQEQINDLKNQLEAIQWQK